MEDNSIIDLIVNEVLNMEDTCPDLINNAVSSSSSSSTNNAVSAAAPASTCANKRKQETIKCHNEVKRCRQSQQQQQQKVVEEWVTIESSFKNRIQTGVIANLQHSLPEEFMQAIKAIIVTKLRKCVNRKNCPGVKVHFTLCGNYIHPVTHETILKYFGTPSKLVLQSSNIEDIYDTCIQIIKHKMSELQERGSSWALSEILYLMVGVACYDPLRGGYGTYVELPAKLKRKRSVLNIKNNDSQCFLWCIVAQMFPPQPSVNKKKPVPLDDTASYRRDFYDIFNLTGITFPMHVENIKLFEQLNTKISINVYGYDVKKDKVIGPLYLTNSRKENHINLLLVKKHYCLITNLSGLVRGQITKHTSKMFTCSICLEYFQEHAAFKEHVESTHEKNNVCAIKKTFPRETYLAFDAFEKTLKTPYVIYADFECLISKTSDNKNVPFPVNAINQHIPYSVGYNLVCSYDENKSKFQSYSGPSPVEWFLTQIEIEMSNIEKEIDCAKESLTITAEQLIQHEKSTVCSFCSREFSDVDISLTKVKHHCHFTGRFIATICSACNIKASKRYNVPIFFHNLSAYDGHLIIKATNHGNRNISVLGKTIENYISFTIRYGNITVRFIDSLRFLNVSLETLASSLNDDDFIYINKHFSPSTTQNKLLKRKGVFCYDYISDINVLQETQLPSKELFYNKLTKRHISGEDYMHALKVWKEFSCKTLEDYSNVYLKSDVLLLSDIFENFRKICMKHYSLDPAAFYTLPGLSWQAALLKSKIKLEYIKDLQMIEFIQKGIRGGITVSTHRYAESNNEHLPNYDKNKPKSYILYIDANSLYGWGMRFKLPYESFVWLSNEEVQKLYKHLTSSSSSSPSTCEYGQLYDKSCVLEVDLDYDKSLHDYHQQLPFCPEHSNVHCKTNKLLTTLENKQNYVIYYDNLIQCMQHGLKLVKIHRVLKFSHKAFLTEYINLNSTLRAQAKSKFEQDTFKLIVNAIFGKTVERVESYKDIKLCNSWDQARKYISKLRYKKFKIFSNNLVAVELNKTKICYNKPIYVGQVILDISKTLMYDFFYGYVLTDLAKDFNVQLNYMDTDSFVILFTCKENTNKSIYEVIKRDAALRFDTSNYTLPNPYGIEHVNKRVLGMFKDETAGIQISHFVTLRPKMYALKLVNDNVVKKAKGIPYSSVQSLTFETYYNELFNRDVNKPTHIVQFHTIESTGHSIYTYEKSKKCLSSDDDKRVILKDNIHTLPYGHYKLTLNVD